MQRYGDEAHLRQLCELFSLASSPDNAVQQQVMQKLNQFSALQDFDMYLVTVFATMRDQPEVVRQRAGLLLKTNIGRAPAIPPQVAEYVQVNTMLAVRDPSKAIRHTAGTVITTIVSKVGVASCQQTLDKLAECLSDPLPEVVEGCFNALNKICEDGINILKQTGSSPQQTLPFVAWCVERLLPRVLEYAAPGAPLHAKQNAIECLNHFALGELFSDPKYPNFHPFAAKYVEVLGVLAQDPDIVVLRAVCKGFVCVIENNWECKSAQMCEVVLKYMLKASAHPDYSVRQEALEVWTPCTHTQVMVQMVRPMLPELIPVLLQNMVYTQADYMGMEASQIADDNANVPDTAEDMKPRFHKEQGGDADDDDEDGSNNAGGAWGTIWTARKAAASSLDNLASTFRQEAMEGVGFLKIVLPLIEQRLGDSNWEVQESGVLALGAIAYGCMESLVHFLPRVMELLLRLCESPKPLVRSISCWCSTRFSQWICSPQNAGRETVLRNVLKALLSRVLDRNKRVQEAACSAVATLEEEARVQLTPFLPDIVQTLAQAFQYYQAKNLLILYDAVGTLAGSVGKELDRPEYVQALMTPLAQKFQDVPDNDRSITALFECLSSLIHNLGQSCSPIVPRVVERCARLVMDGAKMAQLWQQNPNEVEKPDREAMAASVDLLSSIVEGLGQGVGEVLAQRNFLCVVPQVLQLEDTSMQVKQSAFALVGECAKNCIEYLIPLLPVIFQSCAKSLVDNNSAMVSNNASWAVGEICVRVGPDVMRSYLDVIVQSLMSVLSRPPNMNGRMLMQNVCITLGRLGVVCGPEMGKAFQGFAKVWCEVMRPVRVDMEKVTAFQGLCNMIQANPKACMDCVPQLSGAICSFCPEAPQNLDQRFTLILQSYKQALGANWPAVYAQMDQETQMLLAHMYGLSP